MGEVEIEGIDETVGLAEGLLVGSCDTEGDAEGSSVGSDDG